MNRLLVIEGLDPFLEESIKVMGIEVTGKDIIPLVGELNPDIVEECSRKANLLPEISSKESTDGKPALLPRPPLFCAGCPHSGLFFVLSSLGHRISLSTRNKPERESSMIITGDIGCYTLAALPPLSAMDTCACMGAGIGQALGLEKAGVTGKIVAVIGDSTFLHSGITPLVDAVYNILYLFTCIHIAYNFALTKDTTLG